MRLSLSIAPFSKSNDRLIARRRDLAGERSSHRDIFANRL
jgi:hypothetical protein